MPEPLRVLIVEDEAPILLHLEAVVEDEGHDLVGTAVSSRDAIARIGSMAPDLVLLDLHLVDGLTGLHVARSAREAGANFVFMTANPLQVAGFEGAMGILAKPFSRTAVTATLRFVAQCIQDPPPRVRCPPEFSHRV